VTSPLRFFQVASGNVGVEMIKRLANRPDLELVGLHCYSPGKVGRDVEELAGIERAGVRGDRHDRNRDAGAQWDLRCG
jgi:4-hydroxy-tetrahydrodipicolinate reductase